MWCERIEGRICVSGGWMVEQGYMTLDNYKVMIRRGRMLRIGRACRGNSAMIDFETVPDGIKELIRREHGDPKEMLRRNRLVELIEWDGRLWDEITGYTTDGVSHLKPEVQREYMNNAIILAACPRLAMEIRGGKRTQSASVGGVWEEVADCVKRLDRERYPHSLPENARRLQARVLSFEQDGWQVLVHKNFRNANAARVADEAQKALLLKTISHRNNFDRVQVAKLYNGTAEVLNWPAISPSTVGVWMKKYNMEVNAMKRGYRTFINETAMQVRRSAPTAPLYYWTMDGWDVELMYRRTGLNKAGQKVTTYGNRLTMVVVLDPCTMYPVGYAIGEQENGALIKAALRSAVDHTIDLFGARYRPHQIQSDNFGGKQIKEVYEAIAEYYTPAKVGNAKSKVVESYFKYLNKNYCQYMPNWSGFGVKSRKEIQPNAEHINLYKKSFPDKEGLMKLIGMIMEVERTSKREAYVEAWQEMPEERRLLCSTERYLQYFGERTEPNRLSGQGLTPRIMGERRQYDSFDVEMRRHGSERWVCCYDPNDLSRVLALSGDERLHFMLEDKYVQPMALVERKEGDSDELERVRGLNKVLVTALVEGETKRTEIIEDLFDNNPALEGTLGKHLITDSRGQHKEWLQVAKGKECPGKTPREDVLKEKNRQPAPKAKFKERKADATEINYREMMMQEIDYGSYSE